MKELIKIIAKKLFIWSIIINTIYSLADYAQSFALSYFGTSPLNLQKIIYLTLSIFIADILMLVSGKIGSYLDNINETKSHTSIYKYYFNKLDSITMEQITNIHTGYIYKLINNVAQYFFDMIWEFETCFIPVVIGGVSILYMVCKQSIFTGIICVIISGFAVYMKYIMLKKRQKYQKKVNEEESKYNATFIDFIQNIIAVRKLNIAKFCNKKIYENSERYLRTKKINEIKRSNTNAIFTGLMDLLNLIVLISTIIIVYNGEDGLPYLLFYMSALGKLYYNLNSLVRFIDYNEKFKTTKKQLDEYFKNSKEIKLIKNIENVKLKDVVFSYSNESVKIKIPEFVLNTEIK